MYQQNLLKQKSESVYFIIKTWPDITSLTLTVIQIQSLRVLHLEFLSLKVEKPETWLLPTRWRFFCLNWGRGRIYCAMEQNVVKCHAQEYKGNEGNMNLGFVDSFKSSCHSSKLQGHVSACWKRLAYCCVVCQHQTFSTGEMSTVTMTRFAPCSQVKLFLAPVLLHWILKWSWLDCVQMVE